MRDSSILSFLVKAESEGEHRLRVNLYSGEFTISETLLSTSANEYRPGPGGASRTGFLASVELIEHAIAKAATSGGAH